ncbi:hypothetical protein BU24DRAFT_114788 [Aaosphaeria arxii CBS 175.79]|uniref:Uncharacterized protein n=1 Tax=Aaosphaeria arxii CBS 175.79 TaxID=1450172 RepID=A0A6A5Y1Q3_9PLEO|nr:uncharacterized protein BU24DRAFT_114788 [Aaosphaeria arxii CBS 175.79]KAF2019186.1 hypothetical protein BU24DRAFT_114788 [Aaosphaeria arxii CBS 175.79]
MSTQQQSLSEWVTQLNDTLFIQPDDAIALNAVQEQVDPSLVVKYITLRSLFYQLRQQHINLIKRIPRINHNVYTYDQFKPGLLYARSSSTSIQDTFSVILQWENKGNGENTDGVVAVLSKWRVKDKATGKETKKTNVILWEVRLIDGKRKLVGQTEVETV